MFQKILTVLSFPALKVIDSICKSLVTITMFLQQNKNDKKLENEKKKTIQSNKDLKDTCNNGTLQDLINGINNGK